MRSFVCVAIALIGCGSTVDETPSLDGGGDDGVDTLARDAPSDVDTGRDAPPIAPAYGAAGACKTSCPLSAPKSATPCTIAALECEYGESFDPRCNTIARCDGKQWTIVAPSSCPSVAKDACPSSPFGPERGHPCPVEGAICAYSDGMCDCQREGDAGTDAVWVCATFTCKGPRARLGCACTGALSCQHGGCTGDVAHGVDVACNGSFWRRPDSCK
jgi:hypothetical protein